MLPRIKAIIKAGINLFWRMRWRAKLLLVFFVGAVATGGAVVVTGQPGFCNSCHIMNTYYASWENSNHKEVNCLDCHLQPGFTGYIRGKINGLAQAVDCAVGRIGTKPNATVKDASCLRSDCHNMEELKEDKLAYKGVHFAHEKHVGKVVDGIHISCGMCHSHFEGEEHFSVNNDVCFTCHFLGGAGGEDSLVETKCLQCHEVPDKTIERGFVKIDHSEFVSYQASCEESCHGREVTRPSEVEDTVCLSCHPFRREAGMTSDELHESHTAHEKVECFACHGDVVHGQKQVTSVAAMMDCKSCHSETHEVQQSIYSTQEPAEGGHSDRVLSPMFLTHVECTGCHIDRAAKKTASLDSFGRVAKAVPEACDRCHEKGTGAQYVPLWQGGIKSLFDRVSKRIALLEGELKVQTDGPARDDLNRRIQTARSVLESVSADGSWGVHNFKYTEALLLEAEKVLTIDR